MRLITNPIPLSLLAKLAQQNFFNLVKAVVDIEKEIMVVDAELHADEEKFLIDHGSHQHTLWGINLYPDKYGTDDFIEYDSMINLRPHNNNFSRGVDDPQVRNRIKSIVEKLVTND